MHKLKYLYFSKILVQALIIWFFMGLLELVREAVL